MGLGILGKLVRAAIKSYIDSLPDASAGWENESQLEELQVEMFKPVEDWVTPVGGIIAWHKNFPNTPSLPTQFAECNGQVISDSESLYDGQTLPDLNGDARFLRGGSVSGIPQADAFQDHGHDLYLRSNFGASGGGRDVGQEGANANQLMTTNDYVRDPIQINSNGVPRVDNETRPVNMSVVWIMRIK